LTHHGTTALSLPQLRRSSVGNPPSIIAHALHPQAACHGDGGWAMPWRDSANVATDVQALLSEKPQFVQVIDPAQRGTRHSSSVSGKYL